MAIPIAIHLWNIKKGKLLRIGSIALLGNAARQSSKSLRITEWLQLIVRCLLMIVLACLLAKPVWQQKAEKKQVAWILIPKKELAYTYTNYKQTIDSLLLAGAKIHDFNNGFAVLDLKDSTKVKKDTANNQLLNWQLLQQLDNIRTDSSPVHVFTNNQFHSFIGERPALHFNVNWHFLPPRDTIKNTLYQAYRTIDDSLIIVDAVAKKDGLLFHKKSTQETTSIPEDTSTVAVTIFSDKYQQDAAYVQSALTAIKEFTQRKLVISTCNNVIDIPAHQDAIFWLSNSSIDASIDEALQPNGWLLSYVGDSSQNDDSFLQLTNIQSSSNSIKLFKIHSNSDTAINNIITTTNGLPVLSKQYKNGHLHYSFYSRFNPAWNELVWKSDFVQLLLPMLIPATAIAVDDIRMISPEQAATNRTTTPQLSSGIAMAEQKDLSNTIWIIAFVLLATERLLSWKKQRAIHA